MQLPGEVLAVMQQRLNINGSQELKKKKLSLLQETVNVSIKKSRLKHKCVHPLNIKENQERPPPPAFQGQHYF